MQIKKWLADTQYLDERLHYAIAVPANWEPLVNLPLNDNALGSFNLLRSLVSKQIAGVNIKIYVSIIDREVCALDWLEIALEKAGLLTIEKLQLVIGQRAIPDIVTEYEENGAYLISHNIVLRDGSHIFWVQGTYESDQDYALREEMIILLSTFRLFNPERKEKIECCQQYILSTENTRTFQCPASWHIDKQQSSHDSEKGFLETVNEPPLNLLAYSNSTRLSSLMNGKKLGEITVEALSLKDSSSPLQVAIRQVNKYRARGLSISGGPLIQVPEAGNTQISWLFMAEGAYQNQSLEVVICLIEISKSLTLVSLLSPAKSISPETWAINKRAFEIVRDSIRII